MSRAMREGLVGVAKWVGGLAAVAGVITLISVAGLWGTVADIFDVQVTSVAALDFGPSAEEAYPGFEAMDEANRAGDKSLSARGERTSRRLQQQRLSAVSVADIKELESQQRRSFANTRRVIKLIAGSEGNFRESREGLGTATSPSDSRQGRFFRYWRRTLRAGEASAREAQRSSLSTDPDIEADYLVLLGGVRQAVDSGDLTGYKRRIEDLSRLADKIFPVALDRAFERFNKNYAKLLSTADSSRQVQDMVEETGEDYPAAPALVPVG